MLYSNSFDIETFCGLVEDCDYIIGVTRGGLVPAVYLSHRLNKPMGIASYSAGNGDGCNSFLFMEDKKVPLKKDDRITIVDDICDTGETLKFVVDYFKTLGYNNVYSAVIHYRQGATMKPDFYVHNLLKDDPWVHYEWENE